MRSLFFVKGRRNKRRIGVASSESGMVCRAMSYLREKEWKRKKRKR